MTVLITTRLFVIKQCMPVVKIVDVSSIIEVFGETTSIILFSDHYYTLP